MEQWLRCRSHMGLCWRLIFLNTPFRLTASGLTGCLCLVPKLKAGTCSWPRPERRVLNALQRLHGNRVAAIFPGLPLQSSDLPNVHAKYKSLMWRKSPRFIRTLEPSEITIWSGVMVLISLRLTIYPR